MTDATRPPAPQNAGTPRGIAIYGKGGVGKSTVACNLSLLFQRSGRRVLQLGCDPKADSTFLLVPAANRRPLSVALQSAGALLHPGGFDAAAFVAHARSGVHCAEIGGPEPGRGCAGSVIATALKLFERAPGFYKGYDVLVFDVLGDVVCGGFATPLRGGRARETYIVVGEDVASMFAANNIARAIVRNQDSGARLAGLIVNRSRGDAGVQAVLREFASRLGSAVVAFLPHDLLVVGDAAAGATVSEAHPDSPVSDAYRELFRAVEARREADLVVPQPLEDDALFRFLATSVLLGS